MKSLTINRDYVVNQIYNFGLQGKPVPTMKELAETCNEAGLISVQGKEITQTTIQYLMRDKQNIINEWKKGRDEFTKQNPKSQNSQPENSDLLSDNKTETKTMKEFINTEINALKRFFADVCKYAGTKNAKMPTFQELANIANDNNLTTPTGKPVTISTVQRAISGKEMRDAWLNGQKEADPIRYEVTSNAQENETDLADFIKRYCEGKGFLSQPKPTLEQICSFINQQGYKTPIRMTEWTITTLHRFMQNNGISVQIEWIDGLKRANEQTGKSNDIRHVISEVAYEWGLYGGVKQPNINIISEQLFYKNFQTEEGKRLSYPYLISIINWNNIPVFERWNEGVDERMRITQERNQQEALGEEWAKEIKQDRIEQEKLKPIQPKPEQTEAEREFEALQIAAMRKGAQDRANGIVPEWKLEQQQTFPAQAQPLEQEQSTEQPASLHMLNRLLFPSTPVLPPVAVADAPSIEGTPETAPDAILAPPDLPAPSTPDPSPIPKNTPDEWKAWVTSSSFKPLNDEDD